MTRRPTPWWMRCPQWQWNLFCVAVAAAILAGEYLLVAYLLGRL